MPEEGQELRGRLARVNFQEEGSLVPSLLYDTPEHPSSLQLEVTTRCNLRCEYCSNRHLEQTEDLALERFRRLLDRIDLRRVDNVDFTGLGESVLHLQLPEMVREILRRAKPTQLRVVTNGTALTPKRFEPLCEAGITSIAVSVDSLDPEKFARARTGGRLSQVLENLEALVAYRERRRLDGLQIKIKAVLLGDPYGDAEALLAYSARHGLDMPHFSCLDTRAKARSHYRAPWMESAWAEEGGAAFGHWAEHRWRELTRGRPVPAQSSEPSPAQRAVGFVHPSLLPSEDLCRWAVDAAFVSVDGQCLSCCEQMIDLPRLGYGSLESATLAQLWTGALLWGYRLPLSLGAVPSGCVGCPWAPPDGVPMEPSEAPRSGRTMLSE
jgi:molybdenum cofactor biosynthesis enzyme MoaA